MAMHNKPCQMLTGEGLPASTFLETAGHFPRSLVRKSSHCLGTHAAPSRISFAAEKFKRNPGAAESLSEKPTPGVGPIFPGVEH